MIKKMKTTIKLLLVIGILLTPVLLLAQNQRPGFRERLLNARFHEICVRMQLEPAKAQKLKPIYFRYEKEKASVLIAGERIDREKSKNLTVEQEEELYLTRLERAKKLIEIREKFYPEFRTVLSTKEIVQFNRIETELNKKMAQQIRKRLNEREE